ncbi:MAG: tRNA (N(6)-L-threonylcarbamoyladenosine(37)-C(2))-methylthiotransferase MtaB [Clostridia bacterium]|nr:tRNA (N(6)-L-threonylcarbamoyladenosine(37)-C(2))-methylthiotransferase MtaB [Clostridia bacterium]
MSLLFHLEEEFFAQKRQVWFFAGVSQLGWRTEMLENFTKIQKKQKVCLINLGCKVNQYEIDGILNTLQGEYEIITKLGKAEIFIVNTCAVTQEAERKSRQIISKILKQNIDAKIYMCGCATEHNSEQFLKTPQVQCVIGTFGKGKIKENFGKTGNLTQEISKEYEDNLLATNVRTRGYVKIQDGCNNFCSYCIIPYLRGRSRSRALESIVKEAKILSKNCKEIVITGINISDYKIDGKLALIEVLFALKNLPTRVRLGSLEANVITEEFLEKAKSIENFCPHFHLSLQSGSDKVLKEMNRHYTTKDYYEKVSLIRQFFPFSGITTDVIVGYPTETDDDFENTLTFVEKVSFSAVHFFIYSSREGTRASKLPQLNGSVKKQREEKLKIVAQNCKKKYLEKLLSKNIEVLVEQKVGKYFIGFSREYVKCFLTSKRDLTGKIVKAKVGKIFEDGIFVEEIV